MPLFTSASGFQINGGSFIDIAGDVNLHTTQPTMQQESDSLTALEFTTQGLSRQLFGAERNGRQAGTARISPYGMLLCCNCSAIKIYLTE
jgi:hypothetical protein